MAEQKTKIFNKDATLFKDGTLPIYLIADGRFAVPSHGTWKPFDSLKGAEKFVAKETGRKVLKVMDAPSFRLASRSACRVAVIASYKDGRFYGPDGKRAGYGTWYLLDEKLKAEYEALENERIELETKLNKKYKALEKRLRAVPSWSADFAEFLDKHGVPL